MSTPTGPTIVDEAMSVGRALADLDYGFFEEPILPEIARAIAACAPTPADPARRRRERLHRAARARADRATARSA